MKTADHFRKECTDTSIRNITTYEVVNDALVDGGEELLDVAFQDPAGARVILRYLARELSEAIHRAMRALPLAT